MKLTLALSALTCAAAATAASVDWDKSDWPTYPDPGREYCVPRVKLEDLVSKYISALSGITDDGKKARETFDKDVKIYSQSTWWTVGRPDIVAKYAEKDDFPPIFENLDELIKGHAKAKRNPSAYIKGPVSYGCNTFSFYWQGDFTVPGGTSRGRGNGIDMVFVNPKTAKVKEAYSEHNTLNQAYNWGAHITWAKDSVCCDCPVVFNPQCKCTK